MDFKVKFDLSRAFKGEKGFALVLSLVVMAAMTAIGLASVTTATTDMMIARNEKEARSALYLAETGIEEAMGRMGLKQTNARFVGEKSAQKTTRIADPLPNTDLSLSPNNSFISGVVSNLGGSYTVDVEYAFEGTDTWCDTDGCANDETVLYCKDFFGSATGVPSTCDGKVPVLKIVSEAEMTKSKTKAKVTLYVTTFLLNIIPPKGDLFSNGGSIKAAGAATLTGDMCAADPTYPIAGADCPSPGCSDVCSGGTTQVNMNTYIGMDVEEVRNFADSPSPYDNPGTVTGVTGQWGDICATCVDCNGDGLKNDADSNVTSPAGKDHTCGNESKIIFVSGNIRIPSNTTGRGILVVTGNVDFAGDFQWEGAVYVIGGITGVGNVNVFGTMMAGSTIDFHGSFEGYGNTDIAADVMANAAGAPKPIRWLRN